MLTRMDKIHLRKQRRRSALLFALALHGIAIIMVAVWLLNPPIEQSDDRLYAEIMTPVLQRTQARRNVPKPRPKPQPRVVQRVKDGMNGISSAMPNPVSLDPISPLQEETPVAQETPLDAPSALENVSRLAPSPESVLSQSQLDGPELSGGVPADGLVTTKGTGGSGGAGIGERGTERSGFGNFSEGTGSGAGISDLSEGFGKLPTLQDDIGNKLGGILKGNGADLKAHIRIIRLKHSLSDWWQDPTAIPSLIKWLQDNSSAISADISLAGGALPLTDSRILDAPLIIMTGHDIKMTSDRNLMRDGMKMTPGFTTEERAMLRKYVLERGGTLFFDDCGFKSGLARIVEEELRQIFPEYALEKLPHDHEIYKLFYTLHKPPEGGEVFWENENNAQPTKFKFHRGIYVPRTPGARKSPNLSFKDSQGILRTTNRLGVIFNRKDYLCAMETAEIPSRTALRNRRSNDVYRFMTNLMIYTLMYGGNTDRSEYQQ